MSAVRHYVQNDTCMDEMQTTCTGFAVLVAMKSLFGRGLNST